MNKLILNPKILTIITNTPKNKFMQSELLNTVLENNLKSDEINNEFISDIYNNSKITSRYLAGIDLINNKSTINERTNAFKQISHDIIIDMAKQALEQSNLTNNDIHKIIFVSSTGIFAPSIDIEIIKLLNLPVTIERSNILFMGCAAAINAIKNASEYLNSNKEKNVMMITIELSSLHLNFNHDVCDIITHSIFSDGMSVTILSSQSNNVTPKLYILDSFNYIINNSEDGIIISLDNNSIKCKLSKHLPKFINDNIGQALQIFLDKNNLTVKDIDFWAVHPGGKRILESVQNGLNLTSDQLTVSWDILNTYGNMLSSSIMFVLEKFINTQSIKNSNNYCIAFSFSPGVGIEFILFKKQ